jgi:hypothetical protein
MKRSGFKLIEDAPIRVGATRGKEEFRQKMEANKESWEPNSQTMSQKSTVEQSGKRMTKW